MALSLLGIGVDTNWSITGTMFQYGILGIVAFLLGYFAFTQYSRLIERNDALELKVDKLQEDMLNVIIEERDRLTKLIEANTTALIELQRVITSYIIHENAVESKSRK